MIALKRIPKPRDLERLGQSLAMLDAILFPDDWDDRYFSFDAKWARGERVMSMRDGEGDFFFVVFKPAGAVLHGFAHESAMSPWSTKRLKETRTPKPFPGLFEGFPKSLAYKPTAKSFCEDPSEITFVAWSLGKAWQTGNVQFPKSKDPDGAESLLGIFDRNPATYVKHAKEYADVKVPIASVKKIYEHAPLTQALVHSIDKEAEFRAIRKEAKSVGYPIS